jgi:hypothetical protein
MMILDKKTKVKTRETKPNQGLQKCCKQPYMLFGGIHGSGNHTIINYYDYPTPAYPVFFSRGKQPLFRTMSRLVLLLP